MRIVVDTSVWSEFLRRGKRRDSAKLDLLRRAIREKRVQMLGIVRQELLAGIRETNTFEMIGAILEGFPDALATSEDHTRAAQFFNLCRSKGVQGSPVDYLICAQAFRLKAGILTADHDFRKYAEHIPISLIE